MKNERGLKAVLSGFPGRGWERKSLDGNKEGLTDVDWQRGRLRGTSVGASGVLSDGHGHAFAGPVHYHAPRSGAGTESGKPEPTGFAVEKLNCPVGKQV